MMKKILLTSLLMALSTITTPVYCHLQVENNTLFDEKDQPTIQISTDKNFDQIHWQLSKDPEFDTVEREEFADFTPIINLDSCSDMDGESYFFRIQGKAAEGWEEWSETSPFFFSNSIALEDRPYTKPEGVTEEIWREVQPYLLPVNHPIKPILDEITKGVRVTANYDELTKAGFRLIRPATRKKMLVLSHARIGGYLVKTYLDVHNLFKQEGFLWKRRVEGALLIQSTLNKYGYNHIFKVPKKWIYPLHLQAPGTRAANNYPKHFLLIVENMDVYDRPNNIARYKSKTTHEILDALYRVVSEDKLFDSLFLDNIPWCKDGKIAFIDTEYFNAVKKKIKYKKLNQYLSRDMKRYWKKVVKKNGN